MVFLGYIEYSIPNAIRISSPFRKRQEALLIQQSSCFAVGFSLLGKVNEPSKHGKSFDFLLDIKPETMSLVSEHGGFWPKEYSH